MKRIIIIILTFITLKVVGQDHLIGLQGGVTWTNIGLYNSLGKTKGFSGGLTYEYLHSKYFSFGTEIIYNQRGFKTDIIILDNYIPTGEKETSRFNYDYISFPIKTGFNIGHKFYCFGYIGIIPYN